MDTLPAATTRLDERALSVLAHPLRSRLLSALRLDGPATATALARALGTNTGATSYHLRRLADVGLVTETGDGAGRERWWRAAHESHSFVPSDAAGSPDAQAAQSWLRGEYQRQYLAWAEAWAARAATFPPAWQDAAGSSDYALVLTPDQLTSFVGEVDALVERYRTAPPAPAATEDAHPVLVILHTFPRVPDGTP